MGRVVFGGEEMKDEPESNPKDKPGHVFKDGPDAPLNGGGVLPRCPTSSDVGLGFGGNTEIISELPVGVSPPMSSGQGHWLKIKKEP